MGGRFAREIDGIVNAPTSGWYNRHKIAYRDSSVERFNTSLFDNSFYGSRDEGEMPVTNSSVFLNPQQRWVNAYGEYVTKGNDFKLTPASVAARMIVAHAEVWDGKPTR